MAYTISDVVVESATIGGSSVKGLVSVTVSATANGVPYATLVVSAGSPAGVPASTVYAASTADALSVLESFRKDRDKGSTLTLTIVVRPYGGGGAQRLSLSGWPLEDVALAPLAVGACPAVSLTCRHPICRADNGGTLPDDFTTPPNDDDIEGGDPVAAFLSCLSACAAAARATVPPVSKESDGKGATPLDRVRGELLKRLESGIQELERGVSVSAGFPGADDLAEIPKLARAFKPYAVRSCGVLKPLLTSVLPDCSLVLGGDFTKQKLEISPFRPWADPSATVLETEIEHLRLPGVDMAPLLGVGLDVKTRVADANVSFVYDTSGIDMKRTPVVYFPESVIQSRRVGPLQWYEPPAWLQSVRELASSASAAMNSASYCDKQGLYKEPSNYTGGDVGTSGGKSDLHTKLGKVALALAHALYDTTYKSTLTFQAGLRFRPDIFPGRTVAIKTVEEGVPGSESVRGCVLAVAHRIDVVSRSVATELTLAYPVFAGKIPDEIVDGNRNALY